MKRWLLAVCFAIVAVSAALAQEKKNVSAAKPADEGPSLEVTMKFIQDKLNDVGPVDFVIYRHNDIQGDDDIGKVRAECTKVVADPGTCRVSYHLKYEGDLNFPPPHDYDVEFRLKDVQDVLVVPTDQFLNEKAAGAGHPEFSYKVGPPVFTLKVRISHAKGVNAVHFLDEEMANRVAKAMVHAVEVCGGGGKPEPF